MDTCGNVDEQEIIRFDQLKQLWWNPVGEMGTLHTINPLRVSFITKGKDIAGTKILDVGCGGGILAESLAKEGAIVTGIDLSQVSIMTARQHAQSQGLKIDYRCENVDEFAELHADSYDMLCCMEMLEHVPRPGNMIKACSKVLKPGGQAYFSTINRTLKALLFAILIGEYVLHLLPRGSHKYHKLIRPQEMIKWATSSGLNFERIASLIYNPLTRKFILAADREDVNYICQFVKNTEVVQEG
jgi:2-polyprenyl-6-hydroxyphenyl methylase/3-demethylubiquinone-9 3-methyltransferase